MIKSTLSWLPDNNRRPVLAALQQQSPQPHIEFAFFLPVLAVALEAVRLKNRPNVLFKQNRRSCRHQRGSHKYNCNNGSHQIHGFDRKRLG